MTKTKLPKWFTDNENNIIYSEGDLVQNPFSGESYELSAEELSMYDYIMGIQFVIEKLGGVWNPATAKWQNQMRKGLDWFRKNNPEAYMVLLD